MKGDTPKHITEQGVEGYQRLIESYRDHIRFMELQFHNYAKFPEVIFEDMTLREIVPKDVAKLIEVEKSGVLFWAEKTGKFTGIPKDETVIITQQYYVRKVSLDHFYVASQHPEHARRRDFVMINHVYVPKGKTGFELPLDDQHQRKIKHASEKFASDINRSFRIFKDTFTRFWDNVIDKFISIDVKHADVIFLHLLLLWNPQNSGNVTRSTMEQIKERREWAKHIAKEYFAKHDVSDPDERIAKLELLAVEIDKISSLHIEDVHIASLFEICDLNCSDADFESGKMAESVASSLSYLDLDDPFNTTVIPQIPRPLSSRTEGLFDASQNLDLLGGFPSFGNTLIGDNGCFDVPPERYPCRPKVGDAPYERMGFSGLRAPYMTSAQVDLPNKLFERTEQLLSSDVTDDVSVSDEKLKSLVMMAARLLCEHDNLLNSRKKLIESMEQMQQSERDAAIQLISELNVDLVDEESRKLILELSYALKLDIPSVVNGKNGFKPVAVIPPSVNDDNCVPNPGRFSPSLFTVPPPDSSRPPPGFGFEQSVPNLDITRQMNTTPSDRQSPMLAGHPAAPHGPHPNSAPNHSFNPPFPSMLEHPPVMNSGTMFNQMPPQQFYNGPPNGHHFMLPGRSRQPPPPMMMQAGMPKVHLGPVTPVFSHTGYRRRYSHGADRRGRGRSGNPMKK